MSTYGPYSSRRDSFENIDVSDTRGVMDDHWISNDAGSDSGERGSRKHKHPPHPLVILSVMTDMLVIGLVVVLEYFMRWTILFPYRRQIFNCSDPTINYRKDQISCGNFALQDETQWFIILVVGFCLPPTVIFPLELLVWRINRKKCKEFRLDICGRFDVPQVSRRMVRIIAMFAFGAFATLVIVDVIKIMVGRLRPRFIELCQPDYTSCSRDGTSWTSAICEADPVKVRWASTSFPSIHTALTSFCAIYLSVYLHGITRCHGKSLTIPAICLTLMMGIVLCGWSQICQYDCDWIDVSAGAIIGLIVAVYLSVYVLRGFDFRESVSSRKINKKLNQILSSSVTRTRENRSFRKHDRYPYFGDSSQNIAGSYPQLQPMPMFYGNGIPRPVVNRPAAGPQPVHTSANPREIDPRQNTFQRDLQKTIDQYRRGSPDVEWSQHM